MSSDSQNNRALVLGALARELRQFHGLSASFFRAAAARIGMTVTDMQVLDLLDTSGPLAAGQLADLTGLTTGAITGMLNRLEEGRLVRRERDPNDGRKVIVRLEQGRNQAHEVGPMFTTVGKAWDDMASHYTDDQLSVILEFIKRSNAVSRQEIVRLREAPSRSEGTVSAPLGNLESGRLVIASGTSRLTLHADEIVALYQAQFEGPVPEVKVNEGVVTIRYPRRLWVLGGSPRAANVTLSMVIPWQIMIQSKAAEVTAEMGNLILAGLEAKGGYSLLRLDLPAPSSIVPIRINGAASEIIIRRPAGVAARLHLKGWAAHCVFDDQSFSNVGNNVQLHSPDYQASAPYYDIDVVGAVSTITIATS